MMIILRELISFSAHARALLLMLRWRPPWWLSCLNRRIESRCGIHTWDEISLPQGVLLKLLLVFLFCIGLHQKVRKTCSYFPQRRIARFRLHDNAVAARQTGLEIMSNVRHKSWAWYNSDWSLILCIFFIRQSGRYVSRIRYYPKRSV